jgi:hypothetical protein
MSKHSKTVARWPRSWSIDPKLDIPTGRKLVRVLNGFVAHLEKSLSPRTMARHLKYLHLLGGNIIDELNRGIYPEKRKLSGRCLILEQIDEAGAPYYRHVPPEDEHLFDCTCKKLHRFLTIGLQSGALHERTAISTNR